MMDDTKFKYGDLVFILKGFYRGRTCACEDYLGELKYRVYDLKTKKFLEVTEDNLEFRELMEN